MTYPVLAFKESEDSKLYGFKEDKSFKLTTRELLKSGIFKNVFLIDSAGFKYKLENVREISWGNAFWGLNLFRKGRLILIDFDLKTLSQNSLEEIKKFVLKRLHDDGKSILNQEIHNTVNKAHSIKQIIDCFI